MRFTLIILFIGLAMGVVAQDGYKEEIKRQRAEKDVEMQSRKTSPLQKEDRKTFQDLPYFEVDEKWKVMATFHEHQTQEVIEIPTSAGYSKTFKAHGYFEVQLNGNNYAITAFKRLYKEGQKAPEHETLFLPFKDMTTGESTYGGGRYLDLEVPKDGAQAVVDFNLCYSPYCAYGNGFACPIPPAANFIKTEVEAGEKAYKKH
ncbi:MAG TPA: hypothetical protein DCX14_12470 [Flavobacteriales bacterium]|jgi:uncharacterized protein|nr:DUF1684 domain-containing protein [Flavobacteriales bacterium]HAW20988.1 hypothetical protein [Flavobacteriales bacterium]